MVRCPWAQRAGRLVVAGLLAWTATSTTTLPALAQPTSPRPTRTRIAHFPILYNLPLCVAHELGLWRNEGLDSELVAVRSGPLVVAALQSGDVEYAVTSFDSLAHLHEQGRQDAVAIAAVLTRLTMNVVLHREVAAARGVTRASSLTDRFRALRGLTLGVTQAGAVSDLYARYFLRRGGADPDRDATLVQIGDGAALLAALRSRQIQGYVLSAPGPQIAEREGFGTILVRPALGDVPELTDFAAVVVLTGQQRATRQPEQTRAFLSGLVQAQRLTREAAHTPQIRAVARKCFPGLTDDVFDVSLDEILPALSPDGRLSDAMVRRTLEVLVDTGQLPASWRDRSVADGGLWTNRFHAKP